MNKIIAVYHVLKDGKPRTLDAIAAEMARRFDCHAMQTTVSARVRDLRKSQNGGHRVERVATGKRGVWAYQLRRAKA